MILASARTQIADFLSALIYVYTLLIILYIVVQLLFAAGLRPPYSRDDRRDPRLPARRLRTVPADLPARAPVLRRPRLQPDPRDHHAVRSSTTSWSNASSTAERDGWRAQIGRAGAWLRGGARAPPRSSSLDQLTKRAVEHSITPAKNRACCPAWSSSTRATTASPSASCRAASLVVTILIGVALVAAARLLRAPHLDAADLAAHRHADRRRARQHPRPPARRLGHRLRQAAAGLAAVQPRRRLDHARHPDPVPRHRPPRAAAARERGRAHRFTIAFEDEHLLVVDKGPGLVVHPARGPPRGHALPAARAVLAAGGGTPSAPGIVHRLDRDTSGLLVVARSRRPTGGCRRRSPGGEIEREYLALVEGRPPARTGTIEAPIGRDPRVRTRMAVGGAGAREARTHFTLERALPAHLAAAPAPGDRAHAPDPRAPAGDRPPGLRRPRVRHRRACSGSSASSCTPRAWPSSIRSAASASRSSRRSPPTCERALEPPNGYPEQLENVPYPRGRRNAALPGETTAGQVSGSAPSARTTQYRINQGSSSWPT